jgi:AraC-like DNA-binding protein
MRTKIFIDSDHGSWDSAGGNTAIEFGLHVQMLVDSLAASTVAFEVGYESVSQFNREYKRFFGQPPMRDVRTLRSPGAEAIELAG